MTGGAIVALAWIGLAGAGCSRAAKVAIPDEPAVAVGTARASCPPAAGNEAEVKPAGALAADSPVAAGGESGGAVGQSQESPLTIAPEVLAVLQPKPAANRIPMPFKPEHWHTGDGIRDKVVKHLEISEEQKAQWQEIAKALRTAQAQVSGWARDNPQVPMEPAEKLLVLQGRLVVQSWHAEWQALTLEQQLLAAGMAEVTREAAKKVETESPEGKKWRELLEKQAEIRERYMPLYEQGLRSDDPRMLAIVVELRAVNDELGRVKLAETREKAVNEAIGEYLRRARQ
ncbi:MAG TPA: hypothetical protein PK280_12980 [Planctomycetota bacterium]|nr:hypothetical protein [Planctomycetota bacterium]